MKVLENIGQGGFGIVDKVMIDNDDIFARKTFQINQGPHFPIELRENVKKRFIREAKVQSAIKHKNIVPILFKELSIDTPYFLMPLAECSLEQDLKIDHTLGGNFMKAILDIIAALEELHSMKIFHRDLKPANVLRFRDNDGENFYAIGDFGLMSIKQTSISTLTQTGMKMGSDFYTAPEVVQELKNASAQSDIYSLGCIIHDCLVGIGKRIPCDEIKESGEFAAILKNCTRKDPSRRFKSVTALRDALLSLGEVSVKAKTEKGSDIIKILDKREQDISLDEWGNIISFVEDESATPDAVAILRKMKISHIEEIIKKSPVIATRLAIEYANWIRNNSFLFEECDGLAIRLESFINGCDIDIQVECLLAMLYLGTHHNRWYVEQKFVKYVSAQMDQNLAKRLAVEFRVEDEEICKAMNHLTRSIQYNVNDLCPILLSAYKETCKC